DSYDGQPNQLLWAVVEGDRVVASLRTTWFDPRSPNLPLPEHSVYRDDFANSVPPSVPLVSGNRLVTDPDRPNRSSQYVLILLRQYMAVAERHPGWSICAVRRHHVSFYRRVLRMRV